MANLIEYIQSQVYENSTEDISGSIMQQVLTRMASDEGVVNVHTISGQTPFADYNNAQAARDAVPAGFKKLGLIITYKLSSGWYIDEFIGSATSGWSTASNWKCLGPISVSQNASTGKTTITIGSQSYDVATQPVSVSQNTETGHTDIKIGNNTYPVASVEESERIGLKVDNLSRSSNAVDLPYDTYSNKVFDNYVVDTQLTFANSIYRNVKRFDIRELSGILVVNKVPIRDTATTAIVITDINDIVIATESFTATSSTTIYIPIVLAKYRGDACYCYVLNTNDTGDSAHIFYSDDGVDFLADGLINKSNNKNLELSGNIPLLPSSYTGGIGLYNPTIGENVEYYYNPYRRCGISLIRKYIGCIVKINNVASPPSTIGCILSDKDGKIVATFTTPTGVSTDITIDLSNYPNAHYLFWNYNFGDTSTCEIVKRDNPSEKEIEDISQRTSQVGFGETESADESIEFYDNSLNKVGEINKDGADFIGLKRNGIEVATKRDIRCIEEIPTDNDSDEIDILDEDENLITKFTKDGTFSKDFKDLNGLKIYNLNLVYTNINFGVIGDSITYGNQWSKIVSDLLQFATHNNGAEGSSKWACRKTTYDGVTYETQEYDDPNFAGISGGWEPTTDPVEIQKRCNNCAKVLLQRYISLVADGTYPTPDIFCFSFGTNDAFSPDGTDDAIATGVNYPSGDLLFTMSGGMKWCLQKIRETYPECMVIVMLPIQQQDVWGNSQNILKIEKIKQICNAMAIPYIDMFNGCGIAHILETGTGPYLSDGLHPNNAGKKLMGKYAAAQITSIFINIKSL